ncbi:hypothetical protein [Pseudoalteromonas ruthenica]|uniref:Uncharacterized protein n=1 Tax=Pseudoalteromonas ruthenica TaxID=151081 RepID=A0A0F4PW96_9GAMM|nr:hypothetical protein [Pseudoalteromonas ruthenica]KJY97385.1 hypothetical protein TW76_09820 [Pseudoalteromonas ruthenica]KJY99333.1 hypothetical protein TW72_10720 [Pseudoalteromonas ruthenica]TMO86201.1 hypothetical protein CWC12_14250 [Pseudoalteromonas ruthenica]TMO90937.1 hypothetical protein CWC13_17100 [Pseudoalteromonas ruthenica]TMO98603.1 hypothetical protein CWC07_10940 [Pseudoalteromonas ruthenica]
MTAELPWEFDHPKEPGIYFVAIKLGPDLGVYDFLLWSGSNWETDQKGKIIAHVSANTLKEALDISWPENSEVDYKPKQLSESDDDLWTEA